MPATVKNVMDRADIKAGRPSADQAVALRDHIVVIADALFIEMGYGATSMTTIAARARIGKQTLYRRFPDKASLFRQVIKRRTDAIMTMSTDGAVTLDPLNRLKKMGRATLDIVLDSEFILLYRIVIGETLLFPDLACAASSCWALNLEDQYIEALKHAQSIGTCKPGDAKTLAQFLLWGLIGAAFLEGLIGQNRLTCKDDRDAHIEVVWDMFLSGISM